MGDAARGPALAPGGLDRRCTRGRRRRRAPPARPDLRLGGAPRHDGVHAARAGGGRDRLRDRVPRAATPGRPACSGRRRQAARRHGGRAAARTSAGLRDRGRRRVAARPARPDEPGRALTTACPADRARHRARRSSLDLRLRAADDARARGALRKARTRRRLSSVHSDGNWTVLARLLFTGLAPGEHGAHFTPGNSFFFDIADHATLAERLRDVGYRTIGVWANPWLGRVDGMARGFDVYLRPEMPNRLPQFGEAARRLLTPGVHPEVVETERGDLVLARLESELTACGDVPCFAFANLLDAHAYYVPDLCRGRFIDWRIRETIRLPSLHDDPEQLARFEAHYDEELCDLDARLAGFLDRLDAGGLLDSSWVFITSDHGEAFAEHGNIEHGSSAYAEQVRIPLLVLPPRGQSIAVDPAREPRRRDAHDRRDRRCVAPGRGRDLRVEPGDGTDVQASIEFYGDPTKVADRNPRAADPARAVVVDGWKLVEQSGRIELFDLRSDPRERDDLADREPDRVERLRARLPELATSAGPSRDGTISREVLEQLRQLGYGH
ncbi:MAG: sulfatase-like hydrolase/transferase [Myxococcota bacterium]